MKVRRFSFATIVLLSIPIVFSLSGCGLGIVPGDYEVIPTQDALTGTYSFLATTFASTNTPGHVAGNALIGSITFNGSGGISGELDANASNFANAVSTSFSGSGRYTFGADHRGTLTLATLPGAGGPIQFAFTAGEFISGVPQALRFIALDATNIASPASGSGIARRVTNSAFNASTLSQTFAFGLQGETPCNTCHGAVLPFGPLSVVGRFSGSGLTITSGQQDAAAVNTSYNAIGLTGTFTNPDSSGRGTLSLAYTGNPYPVPPAHFVYYIVNSGEFLLMSTDGHATTSLLTGDALVQTSSPSIASLSGAYVIYSEGGFNGDGLNLYPTVSTNTAGRMSIPSPGYLSVLADLNNGIGEVATEQTGSPAPFAVDTNGRMTLGIGLPVFYLAGNGHLFGTSQPVPFSGTNPALLTLEQQSGSNFSCADLTGSFSLGTLPLPLLTSAKSGYMSFTNPSAAAILDSTQISALISGSSSAFTCVADNLTASTGRLLFTGPTGSFAAYPVTQGQRYITVDVSAAHATPTINLLQK